MRCVSFRIDKIFLLSPEKLFQLLLTFPPKKDTIYQDIVGKEEFQTLSVVFT